MCPNTQSITEIIKETMLLIIKVCVFATLENH